MERRMMKSNMTTLCYIEKDGKYLMLHRVSKKKDVNKDKWIGIGGHFEEGESPEECLLREVMEETGLTLTAYRFRGIVTFCSEKYPVEYMCLYTADGFEGKLKDCDEGILEWVDKEKVSDLNLWDGDVLFFDLLKRDVPFFSLKLCYDKEDIWKRAILDGKELELFDICDDKGNVTGHVMERGMVHRLGKLHRTVHIWVIRRNEEGGVEVLLQKRSREKDAYPGCYDISSAGHIHTGDDYLESALRELEEELGIVAMPEDLRLIGFHEGKIEDFFWGEAFKDHEISAVYLYEKPINPEELTLQKEEVEEAVFMEYQAIRDGIQKGTLLNCIYPKEFDMIEDAIKNDFAASNMWIKEEFVKT